MEAFLERWYVLLGLAILLLAAVLRLVDLDLKPFHHDEGVNGFFTTRLMRQNIYAYDPANYHGPSLYYFALLSTILFGLNEVALRLVTALAGLATIALVLPLRRFLGAMPALVAALLLAVSPGSVYISRYFIHEALLVCFTLGLVVSLLFYYRRPNPAFLVAAAAMAALIFATKETGIISLIVLAIAAVIADRYVAFRNPALQATGFGRASGRPRPSKRPTPRKAVWIDGVEYRPADELGGRGGPAGARLAVARGGAPGARGAPGAGSSSTWVLPTTSQLVGAGIVFLAIWVLLFSSFFRNYPKGLIDSLATFMIWTQTGAATQIQPVTRYLEWMAQGDAPLLVLGAAGGVLVALRARDRLTVFIGLWALGITLAYSLIQYKTPWIVVNMLLPLALLAGILIRELWTRATPVAAPLLLGGAVAFSAYQATDLNFVNYDTEKYGYVFVHTTRETKALMGEIERRAGQVKGLETGIVVYSPDYWPLPWYLRQFTRAGYYGQIVPTEESIVITNARQESELSAEFTAAYAKQDQYRLRPGVDLVMYLRRSDFGI